MGDRNASAALLAGLNRVAHSRLEEALTIPPAIYSSEEIHRLELERIFATDWLCPGLAADIPELGTTSPIRSSISRSSRCAGRMGGSGPSQMSACTG